MVRNKVKLSIAGAEYSVITEDEVKYVAELGKDVDRAIAKTMKENPRISVTQAAVLTTLNYADEYKRPAPPPTICANRSRITLTTRPAQRARPTLPAMKRKRPSASWKTPIWRSTG